MAADQIATLLAFANVQMAAEAIFPRGFTGTGNPLRDILVEGNSRNSRFPPVLAGQFSQEWAVLDHCDDTGSGFSGTLFVYTGANDPVRGLVNGQRVISLRSTGGLKGSGSICFPCMPA
jgi:hypothetical protein